MYHKYKICHILFGAMSNIYPFIDIYFFTWQIFQLLIGKKIFLLEMEVRDNNTPKHTMMKISEYMFGKLSYLIFSMIFVKSKKTRS